MDTGVTHAQLGFVSTEADTYKVTLRRGSVIGVGASVSGAGAWVKIKGDMEFKIRRLETSKTYNEIRDKYKFGGGISAFWSWIGIHAGGEKEHEEITKTFHEIQQSQEVKGKASIDMYVSGLYPNVQVDASAYILIFEVEDKQGNTFRIASSGEPSSNTGAQDSNGNSLPAKDNTSTVSL